VAPGPDAVALDPELQVGQQADGAAGAGRLGVVAVLGQGPGGGLAAVVEHRLADEVDLGVAVDAGDGPHEQVVGVVVGRWPGVGGDRVVAPPGGRW
jgi:hypothetical protein